MTTPILKIKVLSKPIIKGKMDVRFPANVRTESFLTVTKSNGTYKFGVDYTLLAPGPISDPATAYVVIEDQTAGLYKTVTLASLLTSGIDADLQAIAALTDTGMLVRTDDDTWDLRTITGTENEITVTNGDGVAGSPTVSLPAALTFTGKTVTGGTFESPEINTPNGITKDDISGLGTAAAADTTDFATAAQGTTADSAVQPGDFGDLALKDKVSVPSDLDVTETPDGTKFLRDDGSWQDIPGGGDLLSTNNLSDLADADTALGNLGGTTVGKAIFTGDGGDARANVGSATMATLCVTFDTYRSAYDNAALTCMTDLGLVGTQFIIPEQIDASAGGQTFTSDEIAILYAKGWEIGAYGSNSGVTVNLADMYTADRASALARLMAIRTAFRAKNIEVVALAPMQRAWFEPQLTEMARAAGFKVVRVVSAGSSGSPDFASYPITEPLNLTPGGDATSMSSTTTASYLNGLLDQAIAAKELMVTVTHEVNTPTDGSTVDPDVLEDFLTYAKGKQDLGLLRITTLSKAMNPA